MCGNLGLDAGRGMPDIECRIRFEPFCGSGRQMNGGICARGRCCFARRNVAVNSMIYEWIMNISKGWIVLLLFINMNSGT
jgi:hypothetical protein